MHAKCLPGLCVLFSIAVSAEAVDIPVATDGELIAALDSAAAGDRILLAPGTYSGGLYRAGLSGVTLTSENPAMPAVIDAGGSGEVLHLTTATDVTIENLVLQNYSANGLNVDDGGDWPAGKSTGITLRDLVIRNDTAPGGNRDGIKLSGVDNFVIDRVQVTSWGTGGSAIDPVGSHHGLIENSIFRHATLEGGSGIRPKGGSKDIQIHANLLDLNAGRAIQAGGSTGAEFFRFVPGDAAYEASQITAFGNIMLGGESAVSWVNIDGGTFGYNYIEDPSRWVMRMLNENTGSEIVDTQNGVFSRNTIVYDDLSRISNHDGPEVREETFSFARNRWFNRQSGGPSGEDDLQLPAEEASGRYGVDPLIDPSGPVVLTTHWGKWIVNPHSEAGSVSVEDLEYYFLAVPGENATLDPLRASPFFGAWEFTQLDAATVDVPAQSQVLLWDGAIIETRIFGDYNGNGLTEQADLDLVLINWGRDAEDVPVDWIDQLPSGLVDQSELDAVLLNWGLQLFEPFPSSVPEPSTLAAVLAASLLLIPLLRAAQGRGSRVASTTR